jgi:SAM-dependent methyltransferase
MHPTQIEQQPASPTDPERVDLTQLWDRLLTCQVELTLPLELPFLFRSPDWRAARTVLDLGCGNGAHLKALSEVFPDKTFAGVDHEPEMIALAQAHRSRRLSFEARDLYDVPPGHPFLMARLVAQHMPSVERFVRHIARLLSPGGFFLSIEPDDTSRLFVPSAPAIEGLYEAFVAHQAQAGYDRRAGFRICETADTFGLRVVERARVVVPSSVPGHHERFKDFHRLIFALFVHIFHVVPSSSRLREALEEWASSRPSYTQLGIHVALLQKIDA